jgi:hypothetical protein
VWNVSYNFVMVEKNCNFERYIYVTIDFRCVTRYGAF